MELLMHFHVLNLNMRGMFNVQIPAQKLGTFKQSYIADRDPNERKICQTITSVFCFLNCSLLL